MGWEEMAPEIKQIPTLEALHSELLELAQIRLPDGRPAFLFRGERTDHPTTFSSLDRLYHDPLRDQAVYDELDDLTAFCMKVPLRKRGLPPKLAGAFAQHYGLPTQVLDFTASPDVAVNFAANRRTHERPWPKTGWIGILDVAVAEASRLVALFDLRNHPEALRARRQEAFGLIYAGYVPDDLVDLKRPEIARGIGMSWRPFAHLPDEENYLFVTGNDSNLEDTANDSAAGIPQEMIEMFINVRGPLSFSTAQELMRRIHHVGRTPDENPAP
jgi:hypothetical protein